jgi:WD40 repeat protein
MSPLRHLPFLLVPLTFACVAEPPGETVDPVDPVDPPAVSTALSACLAEGGSLEVGWSVDNGHGTVFSASHSSRGVSVLGSEDGMLKTWSIETGDLVGAFGGAGGVYGAEFAAGGLPMAVAWDEAGATTVSGYDLGAVRIHDGGTGEAIAEVQGGDRPIGAIAMHGKRNLVAWADDSFSGTPRVLGPDFTQAPAVLETALWGVGEVSFRPSDGALTIAGDWYGVPAFDLRSGDTPFDSIGYWEADLSWPISASGDVRAFAWNAAADTVWGGGNGFVLAITAEDLESETGGRYAELAGHDVIGLVALDGEERFVTAGREGRLVVWDAATLVPSTQFGWDGAPLSLAWDRTADRLVVAEEGGMLRLFGCSAP